MTTLTQFFQRIKIKQLLVTLLAGFLLLTSIACSNGGVQAATPASPSGSPNDIDRPQPGQAMYPTSDVQTGQDTTEANKKAQKLIKEAERRNLRSQGQAVDEALDKLTPNKSVSEQAKDLSQSTKEVAKNAAENTKEGLKNIKENTKNMVDQAADAIN